MHCVSAKQQICCSYIELFSFFWNIQKWSSFWSPIHSVSVVYDDFLNQDFSMNVDWEGGIHNVRTVRFKVGRDIHFFSPQPPPPTILHRGKWEFTEVKENVIEVKASRCFELPANSDYSKLKNFSKLFTERLEKILSGAKFACES